MAQDIEFYQLYKIIRLHLNFIGWSVNGWWPSQRERFLDIGPIDTTSFVQPGWGNQARNACSIQRSKWYALAVSAGREDEDMCRIGWVAGPALGP